MRSDRAACAFVGDISMLTRHRRSRTIGWAALGAIIRAQVCLMRDVRDFVDRLIAATPSVESAAGRPRAITGEAP
jgi:hypothetical protein